VLFAVSEVLNTVMLFLNILSYGLTLYAYAVVFLGVGIRIRRCSLYAAVNLWNEMGLYSWLFAMPRNGLHTSTF